MPVFPETVATPLLAFCLTALVMPFLNRLALRTGFVDVPNSRKIHSHPVPLLGGIGVYVGVVFTLLVRGRMAIDPVIGLMMGASFLVMALGVVDDRLDLHSRYRLILQVAIAGGLSALGVRFHFFPFEPANHVVTVLWVVGVINAMNCLDCADGAAGGTSLIAFLALGALAHANGREFVFLAALAGAGAIGGFLIYNVPPARVFLGDTGSTFIGLMVAVLAILAAPAHTGAWRVPMAPFVLAIPIFDIAWVHYRRYQAGIRSVRDLLSSTGKDHLPHRLMTRGLSKPVCMVVVAVLTFLTAAAVYTLSVGAGHIAAMAVIAVVAFIWHLEENAEVVIRPDDQVALYQVRSEISALQPSFYSEEGVA